VSSFETRRAYYSGFVGFLPKLDADAPLVAGFESREAEFRPGSDQVIADGSLVLEKLVVQQYADRMLSNIVRTRVAFSIAIKSGQRIGTASLQRGSQNVLDHL